MSAIIARVYYLNIIIGSQLRDLSDENYHSQFPIDAPRGSIKDRNGAVLATNQMVFNVMARAYRLDRDALEQSFATLEQVTGRSMHTRLDEVAAAPRESFVLLKGLDFEAAAPVVERLGVMPGISVEPSYRRFYPNGTLNAHILGFVGDINRAQYERLREAGYGRNDRIGQSHIESLCESNLRGLKGLEVVRSDARGRVREVLYNRRQPARPGLDVTLTIDLELQRLAMDLITTRSLELMVKKHGKPVETRRAAVLVAMDPRDGQILAMASYPTFDPNRPGYGGTRDYPFQQVSRAVSGFDMPGSVFKLVTAYAALEAGVSPSREITCNGRFYIRGWKQPYMCDNRWGHGPVDMSSALEKSCNVYFYTMAAELGSERLAAAARKWGFGTATGVDFHASERAGLVPTKRVLPGENLHFSIGQGRWILASPLQVLRAYAALGNGGRLVRPYAIAQIGDRVMKGLPPQTGVDPEPLVKLPPEWREPLVSGFWRVIQGKSGTGRRAGFSEEWDAAGKTSSVEKAGHSEANAWFVCFAPRDNPVIALLATVENSGHGGDIAAPLCREFMEDYFRRYPLARTRKESETKSPTTAMALGR